MCMWSIALLGLLESPCDAMAKRACFELRAAAHALRRAALRRAGTSVTHAAESAGVSWRAMRRGVKRLLPEDTFRMVPLGQDRLAMGSVPRRVTQLCEAAPRLPEALTRLRAGGCRRAGAELGLVIERASCRGISKSKKRGPPCKWIYIYIVPISSPCPAPSLNWIQTCVYLYIDIGVRVFSRPPSLSKTCCGPLQSSAHSVLAPSTCCFYTSLCGTGTCPCSEKPARPTRAGRFGSGMARLPAACTWTRSASHRLSASRPTPQWRRPCLGRTTRRSTALAEATTHPTRPRLSSSRPCRLRAKVASPDARYGSRYYRARSLSPRATRHASLS